jgi:hypothetical protein
MCLNEIIDLWTNDFARPPCFIFLPNLIAQTIEYKPFSHTMELPLLMIFSFYYCELFQQLQIVVFFLFILLYIL